MLGRRHPPARGTPFESGTYSCCRRASRRSKGGEVGRLGGRFLSQEFRGEAGEECGGASRRRRTRRPEGKVGRVCHSRRVGPRLIEVTYPNAVPGYAAREPTLVPTCQHVHHAGVRRRSPNSLERRGDDSRKRTGVVRFHHDQRPNSITRRGSRNSGRCDLSD